MATAEERAKELLGQLPTDLPTPEWIREPNGDIGLDWIVNHERQVSADVKESTIEVAARIDHVTTHLELPYSGGPLPARLLDLLHQLTAPK